jgi:acetoacetate decarboxylase
VLKGFNYPLTPKGKSTLNPPPPWHYSPDFLSIEFWADPSAVAATLPTGLDPDPKAAGHANALFYDWQFSGSNEEYLDPARYQYREFFILVDAIFEGRPVSYCPYIFVDNDAALARGWTQASSWISRSSAALAVRRPRNPQEHFPAAAHRERHCRDPHSHGYASSGQY